MSLSAKALVSRLPSSVQGELRKHHYLGKLKGAAMADEDDLGVIPLLVREGDVAFDIGANFGLFTRFLSEAVGAGGRVYSFEPTPDMFEVLSHSARRLGLENVSCLNLAVSDKPGLATMSIPIRRDGSRNHYEATLVKTAHGQEVETVTAEMVSLDGFCESRGIERIDFIKCDVEGHELAVLRGAAGLLKRYRPSILLEVNDPLHEPGHGSEVRDWIEAMDYEIRIFEGGELVPWRPGEVRVNYVLVPV